MAEQPASTTTEEDEDETSDFVDPFAPDLEGESQKSWGDKMIKPIARTEVLPPRYRRIAEFYAAGMKPGDIAEALNYTKARISVILSHTRVRQEIAEIQGIEFVEPLKNRMKRFGTLAMDNLERDLRGGGSVTPKTQNETSKWVFEQIEGKPQQKVDIGDNLLGILVDRFDKAEREGKILDVTPEPKGLPEGRSPDELSGPVSETEVEEAKTQRDELDDWFEAN